VDPVPPWELLGDAQRQPGHGQGKTGSVNIDIAPASLISDAGASDTVDPGIDGPSADGAPAPAGTIVPLYTYPTHSSWNTLREAKQAHPAVSIIAVANVSSGPGAAKDPAYATGIRMLASAGVTVVGYTHTSYGGRTSALVKAEMEAWKTWYPEVQGIFFDQQASQPGHESYYKDLSSHAASLGMHLTVGNPGTDVAESYVGTVDTMLIYDDVGLPSLASLQGWHLAHESARFGIIPYAVPALDLGFVAQARSFVGYIYVTDDTPENPWDSLPSYFAGLVAGLDA
jgi:hypothetical protein